MQQRAATLCAVATVLALCAAVAQASVSATQLSALMDIYNYNNGAHWLSKTNWTLGDPCTNTWYGVKCDTANANIVELTLRNNNLTGYLMYSTGSLTALQRLNLNTNSLQGFVPYSWTTLSSLTTLDLSSNMLTGGLQTFARLTSLLNLIIRNNQISGPIGFMRSLSNLELLSANNNLLYGPFPSDINQLYFLSSIYVSNNNISGSLPTGLLDLHALHVLVAENNQLSGLVPPFASGQFTLIDLSGNGFECPIPTGSQFSSIRSCAYCEPGMSLSGGQCVTCPPGSYSNGLTVCMPCPGGSYAESAGSSSCTICPTGTFTIGGSTGCLSSLDLAQFVVILLIVIVAISILFHQCCHNRKFSRAFSHRLEPLNRPEL